MTTTKTCTQCGVAKPLDEYHRNKNTQDGRRSECKTCKAVDARRYREANREKAVEYQRRYREENRDKVAEQQRRHYEENREKLLEQRRRYYEENREEIAEKAVERDRRYFEKHRDYVNQRRRENNRDSQRLSLYTAHRRHHRWTLDDDDMILNSPMTVFQIAVALNKTYNQVTTRRRDLRRKLESA